MKGYPITLDGKSQGWVKTSYTVNKGQVIRITANGIIRFASKVPFSNGYPRDPDGKDEHGKIENAPNDSHWPAPNKIRNSLLIKVGNWIEQAGTHIQFIAKESGVVEMTNNDENSSDNEGSWNVYFDIQNSTLFQKGLFLIQGSKAIADKKSHYQWINEFSGHIQKGSKGKVFMAMTILELPGYSIPLFDAYNYPDYQNKNFRQNLQFELNKYNQHLKDYDFVILFFDELQNGTSPKFGGLTWARDKCSLVPYWVDPSHTGWNNNKDETILHEYLHHYQHYFPIAGINGFVDIHCWNGNNGTPSTCIRKYNSIIPQFASSAPGSKLDFYFGAMQWIDNGKKFISINYEWLNNIFGKLV